MTPKKKNFIELPSTKRDVLPSIKALSKFFLPVAAVSLVAVSACSERTETEIEREATRIENTVESAAGEAEREIEETYRDVKGEMRQLGDDAEATTNEMERRWDGDTLTLKPNAVDDGDKVASAGQLPSNRVYRDQDERMKDYNRTAFKKGEVKVGEYYVSFDGAMADDLDRIEKRIQMAQKKMEQQAEEVSAEQRARNARALAELEEQRDEIRRDLREFAQKTESAANNVEDSVKREMRESISELRADLKDLEESLES